MTVPVLSAATVKRQAAALGFEACGLARAVAVSPEREAELRRWLAEGCQGDMDYLSRHLDLKLDPRRLVEGARTIVSLALNYYPGGAGEASPCLARYAQGTDYHDVMRQQLRALMASLGLTEGVDGRCCVDTAPVDEKYWAVQAGLGWRGRHSQLIVPGLGSYCFLGELILVAEADAYDRPMEGRCGRCRACVEACPAHALRGDGTMDARRCLSYLTIEYRGELPPEAGEQMGGCFYGCDRCAEACPWNRRYAHPATHESLRPRPDIVAMTPEGWCHLTPEKYRALFRKSAVKRAKYEGLMRNIHASSARGDDSADGS